MTDDDLMPEIEATGERLVEARRMIARRIIGQEAVVEETLHQESEERVVLAGTANLARSKDDFARSLGPVLEALEEQVVLMRLLSDMAEDSATVSVRIGHETQHDGLVSTSFVTSGYGDESGAAVARVGAIDQIAP